MDTRNFSRSLINLVSLLSLVALAGCVMTPPIRVPTAIRTASGPVETFANWQTPVVGVITRKQVDEQYHAFAINSGVPNLFLGEFDKSTWAMLPERLWGTNNIIAVFDEKDVLKSFEIVPQDKLFSRFVKLQQAGTFPPLNLSRPISMSAMMADLGQKRISRMFVTNRESVSVLLTSSGLILTPVLRDQSLFHALVRTHLSPRRKSGPSNRQTMVFDSISPRTRLCSEGGK